MKNLKEIFAKYNLNLSNKQCDEFEYFYKNQLLEANKIQNLTTVTEEQDVIVKHFLDSVLPAEYFENTAKVVDVGSGAGFPAIPLKIYRPDLDITMVDSLQKRVNFLNRCVDEQKWQNIHAEHARVEDFAKQNREKFDIATARAVASLNTLVEYLLPLIKIGGKAIIYKSTKLDEELVEAKNAIKILGGEVELVKDYHIDEADCERKVLVIKKVSHTPPKYPRDKNKARLAPLK